MIFSPSNSPRTSPVPICPGSFRFRSIQYPHRPHERFSCRHGRKTVIFSRFLHDCGRLEYAIKNRRKTRVRTRMVHLQPEFEGRSPNESTTGLPEDNLCGPLSRYYRENGSKYLRTALHGSVRASRALCARGSSSAAYFAGFSV